MELRGLGFIVPVLLPGTACLSAPSLLWRGGWEELRREGLKMNVLGWSPELGSQMGLLLLLGGGVLAPL